MRRHGSAFSLLMPWLEPIAIRVSSAQAVRPAPGSACSQAPLPASKVDWGARASTVGYHETATSEVCRVGHVLSQLTEPRSGELRPCAAAATIRHSSQACIKRHRHTFWMTERLHEAANIYGHRPRRGRRQPPCDLYPVGANSAVRRPRSPDPPHQEYASCPRTTPSCPAGSSRPPPAGCTPRTPSSSSLSSWPRQR